jgi:hypothetical protein
MRDLGTSLVSTHGSIAPESRSGLEPWTRAELPVAPDPRGLGWLKAVGPGIIVLGVSIGSGEFLLGPAAFVRYGLSLLWITTIAIFLQTIFNTELMRYTLATGEPVFTGFMRTRPSSTAWACLYALLYFLQVGWPAWAANAAGAIFFLLVGRLAAASDAATIYSIGVVAFLACVVILSVGRRIEHTLEVLNWILVISMLGAFVVLTLIFVPAQTWTAGAAGLAGYDAATGQFNLIPEGSDFFLLSALVGYSGCGGVVNLTLSNWARDKGYGMAARAGYIPAAVGGSRVELAHSGFMFEPGTEPARRWAGWWRVVRVDQWIVFCLGALLGMLLPALLYVTFLPRGANIESVGIGAALADAMSARSGLMVATVIGFLGAWILFKTQLDNLEGMVRAITDILWTGSRRVRGWRGGDVRAVYYSVLGIIVLWGIVALRLAQPVVLLKLGANVASFVFVIASLHLLYVNTRLLPEHVRPPMWRRIALVAMAVFYGFFVVLAIASAFTF